MAEFIFGTVWGWIGTAGVIVLACLAVAWLIPQSRPYAIAIAAIAVSVATAFTKGYTARGNVEARRKEEAVRKAQKEYADIDARPDTADDVVKRMRDGGF